MKLYCIFVFLFFFISAFGQEIPCDGPTVILDNSSISSDTIAASDSLLSSSIITSGTVKFQSPIMICLENGFEVLLNAEFSAYIEDCSSESVFSFVDVFGDNIKLDSLFTYADQTIPDYITKDNTGSNVITNIGATLGRVLFYDKNLSLDQTVSCSSCHQQINAFSDLDTASTGINGTTGRHSMRLINGRFATEEKFFWDERADNLESQTTQPIQDHVEMGFSGTNGDPTIDSLLVRLSQLDYYPILFDSVYNSTEISESKIQNAIAQFIRSIQSFDSPFDIGRSAKNNHRVSFDNFSDAENRGKTLFLDRAEFDETGSRTGGGLSCQRCHRAPEFDIDPNSRNNGVISVIGSPGASDLTNTRSPSLRDLFSPAGTLNGPLMHNGSFSTIEQVIDHYDNITVVVGNNNLDNRLRNNGLGQQLNITTQEKADLIAFLKTLTGNDVYTNVMWSDPFIE